MDLEAGLRADRAGSRLARFLFEGVHQLVAHPLLFLSGGARWAVWLHDEAARLAFVEEKHGTEVTRVS
jgi:hypothetical protein